MVRRVGRRTDLLVGSVGTLVFLGLGLTLLGFSGRSIKQSLSSSAWPTVPGVMTESGTKEGKLSVRYSYKVDGQPHDSTRIGFDIFDKPGGRGRWDTLRDRYPVGAELDVHVRPGAPEQAVLETGDVAPFIMPSVFGLMFLSAGVFFGRMTCLHALKRPTAVPVDKARRAVSIAISVALALMLGGLAFDGATQDVVQRAFGPWISPGVPTWFVALAFIIICTAWLPVAIWQGIVLVGSGVRPSPLAIVATAVSGPPQLRQPARRAAGALLYFAVVLAVWIAFSSWRGV